MDHPRIIDFAALILSHSDEKLQEILTAIYHVEPDSAAGVSTVPRGEETSSRQADPTNTRLQQPHSKVLLGMDPSQMISAEILRASGGASMIDAFLGLDHQSSVSGLLLPPPLIPGMFSANSVWTERNLKALLRKHRLRARLLKTPCAAVTEDNGDSTPDNDSFDPADEAVQDREIEQGYDMTGEDELAGDLEPVARMLDVLEALVLMRDYSLSRMGQFFKG